MNQSCRAAMFVLIAALLCVCPPAYAGPASFCGEFVQIPAGSYPSGIIAADADGDGQDDLVLANEADHSLSVLWSNGNATFRRLDIAVGGSPVEVAATDLDGDGSVDIVASDASYNGVVVVHGDGSGGFGAPSRFPTDMTPWSLGVGDLNGDGLPDVVVGAFVSNTIAVLLGEPGGTFTSPTVIEVGTVGAGRSVAIGDVTGDQVPDVVVAGRDSMTILAGRGDGAFDVRPSIGSAHDPMHVALADLNGDGSLDILVASADESMVFVHMAVGGGIFAPAKSFGTGNGPFWVAVSDVNGDGKMDIVAPDNNDGTASILLGDGVGSFAPRLSFATGNAPRSLAVGDFNADGREDLVAANLGSGTLSLLIQNADGTFGCRERYGVGDHARSATIANLDGDRWPDVAVLNGWAYPGTITVWHGSATAKLVAREDLTLVYANPTSMVAADINNDGAPDLIATTAGRYVISIFAGGESDFSPRQDIDFSGCPYGLAVADVTGDHYRDLVVTDPCDSSIVILRNDGGSGFSEASRYPVSGRPEAVAAADLNRDGRIDLVVVDRLESTLSVFLQDPSGEFQHRNDYDAGEEPTFASVADVNRDGFLDVIVANLSRTRTGSIFLGAGDGTLNPPQVLDGFRAAESFAIGDLDLDGEPDVVFPNAVGNTASIFWGSPAGLADQTELGAGFNPSSAAIGDLDLDGLPDLVVTNEISHDISVYRNRGPRPSPPPANSLIGNRPNPFNPGTIISYVVARPGHVAVRIYEVTGRLVRTLSDGIQSAGTQTSFWDGRMDTGAIAPSGVYLCRITFPGGEEQSRKLALVR